MSGAVGLLFRKAKLPMSKVLHPLLLLVGKMVYAQLVRENEFLRVENRILRRRAKDKVIPTPEERAELVRFGRELGSAIKQIISIVHPITFAKWLRWAANRDPSTIGRKVGRKCKSESVKALVVRMANENPQWGYERISGELKKLDIRCCGNTVKRILVEAGLAPRPNRRKTPGGTWNEFLKQHAESIVACDFFTKPVWTLFGRATCYVLFFIHLGSRKVWISPCTPNPDARWVEQQARNFYMAAEDMGIDFNYFIHDRDQKFTEKFREVLSDEETRYVQIPRKSPNCNAYSESWVASLKRECLDNFVCFGQEHLDYICQEYARFHNCWRPHQGKGNGTLAPLPRSPADGEVVCESQLGGLLRHYYRSAA